MFFYKLTPLLSRTEFIVFHGNHLSLILPFPSLTVLSPMCSKACSLCSPTPSSRLAPKAEWGLTLPILTAGNARLVLALVLVVFFFFFSGCALWQNLSPISLWLSATSTLVYSPKLIQPAFPSSRSLLMLVPVGSWDALPHLPTCYNLVLSCPNLHPRHPQLPICWAPGSQWDHWLLAIF